MKIVFAIILIIPIILLAERKSTNHKSVPAFKISRTEIEVDGKLNEPFWNGEAVTGFVQKDPQEGNPATEETNVWVAYDEDYIYVAARLKDSQPNMIDLSLTRRDAGYESDKFAFFVDPYNDKKTGYFFVVNASGSISDGILFNDSWDDDTWDGVWEAKTSVDEFGWIVEMKIPFSQLRFNKADEMVWGVNFGREIKRLKEQSYFVMVPKNESGFVSRFAELKGLKNINPSQRFEILPYIVQKAQYLKHESDDPFYKSNQYKTTLGADLKIGLGSSLNIDATINPDFGQVEVDPAVINLSAFESYFQEKRPFFIEGSSTFMFGIDGANNNWGFNFGWPELFYSRRIGRSPQGSTSDANYINYPTESRILGAAKLTGKIDEQTTIGAISAVTERTYAKLYNDGLKTNEEVEPFSHYGIIRLKRELNGGMQSVGLIATSVNRDLSYTPLSGSLAKNAFTFGLDGYTFLDDKKIYVVTGAFAGSYIHGTKEFMGLLQKKEYRYFQRPDATYATFNPNLESLGGWYGRLMLNKQEGDFYINAALGAASPGFEHNDLGFQFAADRINSHLVLGYRWFQPDGIFRRKMIYVAHARTFDFEGNLLSNFIWANTNFQFENYWGFGLRGNYTFETFDKFSTRGGPLMLRPSEYVLDFNSYSDSREKLIFELYGTYAKDKIGGSYKQFELDFDWRPNSQIQFSIGPGIQISREQNQWVGNFDDVLASKTYNTRHVFARLDQKVISGNIRLNWTFTPQLSLQLFMQPLFAVGDYSNYKELAKPRSLDFFYFGQNGSSINYDKTKEEYTADPDGQGGASPIVFNNPNFNFKSLRGNAVLRWEFMPGSIFYFVWSHNQQNYDDPGNMDFRRDFKNLWNAKGDDVFMIKFSYWFDA
ncbi:MAG: carbohydrate binding family 9 domain-containing protein [Melioribacteraceae bacterium]|nr:carbohydrate binding family 9 domain-containing protein [Melioribacteraceae bacterium]